MLTAVFLVGQMCCETKRVVDGYEIIIWARKINRYGMLMYMVCHVQYRNLANSLRMSISPASRSFPIDSNYKLRHAEKKFILTLKYQGEIDYSFLLFYLHFASSSGLMKSKNSNNYYIITII